MRIEEYNELRTEEIYDLFDKGYINATEFDSIRKTNKGLEFLALNGKLRERKKKDILSLYEKGELSISDTIAYESSLLLNRNRKNTSTIVTVITINIALIVLAAAYVFITNN